MCGIIGYVGENNAVPYLISGLKKLEYRGYDSSGIALQKGGEIFTLKRQGKIDALENAVSPELFSFCGIGHTRWATHGRPSQKNAHPHLSRKGIFAVVHNGIIENCEALKDMLSREGYSFISDTDTEVIAQLLERNYQGAIEKCLSDTVKALEGSFALGIIHKDYPKTIFCAKKDSPLLVSVGSNGGFVFSDTVAATEYCECYYSLCDYEFAKVTGDSISFFDTDGKAIYKTPKCVCDKDCSCGKAGFPHYMLKEIYEQPEALQNTLNAYLNCGVIHFPLADMDAAFVQSINRIHIVGCGSAYHAGVYGKYITEELTDISTTAEIASEFRYSRVPLDENCLVVVISQSGETADTLAALRKAKQAGAKTLSIINSRGSTMADISDMIIYTEAGTEVSVATTKAYLCQNAVLYLLGVFLSEKLGRLSEDEYKALLDDIASIAEKVEIALGVRSQIYAVADKLKCSEHIYFIGRNTDYALSLEGSLKLKEISYIHCEAYPAGELKHGTISLIEKGTPVVAVCLRSDILKKTVSGIKEVKARGAKIVVITREELRAHFDADDTLITIPCSVSDMISPVLGAVPLQLLSYHTAVDKGCEVDKPRNLAKSVTVE